MKSNDALLAAWDETLARKGDTPAILATSGQVLRTFRAIEEYAHAAEAKIGEVRPGSIKAIDIGNHPDWPSVFLACLRKELVVLPLDQSMRQPERDRALSICSSIETWDWHGRGPCLLKLTSGTSGAPRAIRFRSEQLLADCNQICATMGISDVDLNFGVIPISHSYGFSNLLTPLLARGVPVVLSRDQTPRAVLNDLARTGATVFPGMPIFYQAFCEIENLPALPKLRLCISAGAPLSAEIAKKFSEKFNQPIHSFYGSSECGGICYDRDGTTFEDGFVGEPMKDVDLALVDPKAGSSQVRVRSAAAADGYFPENDAEKLSDGVFVPDDLLARHGNGFKIVGRISDVINVAGKKVHPAEVESQLVRFPGVRQAIVFGRKSARRNEEVAGCVVANSDVREIDLLEFCRKHLSGWQVPKRIFMVDKIPVSERGKISRRELAAHFSDAAEIS